MLHDNMARAEAERAAVSRATAASLGGGAATLTVAARVVGESGNLGGGGAGNGGAARAKAARAEAARSEAVRAVEKAVVLRATVALLGTMRRR